MDHQSIRTPDLVSKLCQNCVTRNTDLKTRNQLKGGLALLLWTLLSLIIVQTWFLLTVTSNPWQFHIISCYLELFWASRKLENFRAGKESGSHTVYANDSLSTTYTVYILSLVNRLSYISFHR